MESSRVEIEQLSGRECRHFSYPNGDYGLRELRFVEEAGYASGRSIDLGWNDANTNPRRLKILSWRDDTSVNRLVADLIGSPAFWVASGGEAFEGGTDPFDLHRLLDDAARDPLDTPARRLPTAGSRSTVVV